MSARVVLAAAVAAMDAGRETALCTVVGVNGSTPRSDAARMLVYPDGELVGTVGGGEWEHRVVAAALEALRTRRPTRLAVHLTRDLGMCCGGAMEALIEPLGVRERVHLLGAGHVSAALAPLLCQLDYEVFVYDDRDEWLTPARFGGCTRVPGDPRRTLPAQSGARDHFIVLTHSHQLDQDLLQDLIHRPCAYLGMIGSRSKVAKFFLRLRAAGVDEALFARVSAPIGLDIGAETPEEIAVSIAAELIRVRRRHTAPPRPMSEEPLPARGGSGVAVPPALLTEGVPARPPSG